MKTCEEELQIIICTYCTLSAAAAETIGRRSGSDGGSGATQQKHLDMYRYY